MDGFEMERLAMQLRSRRGGIALKLPGKNRGKVFVVAERFALLGLMFFPKMCAAGFIARQRVETHQFGEFEKIGDASGSFKRLVEIFAPAWDANISPEFFAQVRDFLECFFQSLFVSRHSTFVPEQ